VSPDDEAAGPGLADDLQPVAAQDHAAKRLIERDQITANLPDVANLAVTPGLRRGEVDAFLKKDDCSQCLPHHQLNFVDHR
jgi:hypothetical protein